MLLLDTTAVSDLMHRRADALGRLREERPRDVVLCSPVAAEINLGLERLLPGSRRRELLAAEFGRLRDVLIWADWDEPAALRFGTLKAALQADGTPIDDMDLVIASISLTVGARLATSNLRHFELVPGLVVDDWG